MFKTIVSFLILLFYGNILLAQNQAKIDSLLKVTKSNISDKEKVDTYIDIAIEYNRSDSSNTIKYAQIAIDLAEKIKYSEGKLDALFEIGWMYLQSGAYSESEDIFTKILQEAKILNYQKGKANSLNGFGILNDYQGNYEKALEYYFQALEISKEIKDDKGLISGYRNIGHIYSKQNDSEKALEYYFQSLEIAEKFGDQMGISSAYISIGIAYTDKNNYKKALEYYFQALEILEEIKDKRGISFTLNNIGQIYANQGDYNKALDFYFRSLEIKKELGDKRRISTSYNNIGIIYLSQNNFKEALKYHFQALEIRKELGDKDKICSSLTNIGSVYLKQNKYKEALDYYFQALEIAEKINSKLRQSSILIGIGTVYNKQQQWDNSQKYLIKALRISQEIGVIKNICNAAEQLSFTEKELGNYQAAYEAHTLFKQMEDSLQNEEQTEKIIQLEAEYEFKQEKDSIQLVNETERITLEKDIEQRKALQLMTLISLGFAIVLIVVLFFFFKTQRKNNRTLNQANEDVKVYNQELQAAYEVILQNNKRNKRINLQLEIDKEVILKAYEKNKKINTKLKNTLDIVNQQKKEITIQKDQLQELNKVKDRIFSIIAHDLRSPINNLQGLLMIIGGNYGLSQEETQENIQKLSESFENVSGLLNNLLYWARSQMQEGFNLSPSKLEVQLFIQEVVQLLSEIAQTKHIQTIIKIDEDIPKIYADPEILRFLLRNLLNNAYKFSHERGKVTIQVIEESNKQIKISITDEGIGMDETTKNALFKDFVKSRQGTRKEKGTGLGLMLCKEFIELSGGNIGVESELGRGSTFWFTLPSAEAVNTNSFTDSKTNS